MNRIGDKDASAPQHCVTQGKECQEKTNYSKQHISQGVRKLRKDKKSCNVAYTDMKLALKHIDTDSDVLF